MFRFIPLTNNSYIINTPSFQKTINKNSGLVEKITNIVVAARTSETTVIFNANVVTDENVIKPTI